MGEKRERDEVKIKRPCDDDSLIQFCCVMIAIINGACCGEPPLGMLLLWIHSRNEDSELILVVLNPLPLSLFLSRDHAPKSRFSLTQSIGKQKKSDCAPEKSLCVCAP